MRGKMNIVNRCSITPNVQIKNICKLSEDIDCKPRAPSQGGNARKPSHVSDLLKNGNYDRQTSVDFETAIEQAGYGKFNYFLLLVSLPVSVSAGMNTGSISFVLPAIDCDFQISDFEKGFLQIASYIGMIVSAFFWGSASDSFGRKKLLMYGFLFDAMAGIGASLSPTLGMMIVCKMLNGAMNSGPFSIFMAYLSEIFVKEHRDFAVLSSGVFSAIGNFLQPVLALMIMWVFHLEAPLTVYGDYKITSWRIFLFACSMPSLICAISCAFFIESPKFLLEKGRKEEALGAFQTIYTVNTGLPASTYPVLHLHDVRSPSIIVSSKLPSNQTFFARVKAGLVHSLALFKKPYIGRVAYYFAIQAGAMAGYNSFRLWLPQMFTIALRDIPSNSTVPEGGICDMLVAARSSPTSADCGVASPISYVNMMIINSGLLISHPLFILCVKFFGKKTPIVLSTLVPSFFVFAIPFIPASKVVYVAAVFMSILNVSFFALLTSVVDTFPTHIKALSVSMTQSSGRIGVLCTNFFVALLVFDNCSVVILAIGSMLFVVGIIALMLPTSPIEVGKPNPKLEDRSQQK